MTRLNSNALSILAAISGGAHTSIKISSLVGFSRPGAIYHLNRLRRLGLVSWEPLLCATIHLTCRFVPADEVFGDGVKNENCSREN